VSTCLPVLQLYKTFQILTLIFIAARGADNDCLAAASRRACAATGCGVDRVIGAGRPPSRLTDRGGCVWLCCGRCEGQEVLSSCRPQPQPQCIIYSISVSSQSMLCGAVLVQVPCWVVPWGSHFNKKGPQPRVETHPPQSAHFVVMY
jgi:hypothetical protein